MFPPNPEVPCARCMSDKKMWKRHSGARWGLGLLCKKCYSHFDSRDRQKKRGVAPRTPNPLVPCAKCHTMGGPPRECTDTPRRITGARWGLGLLCKRCYDNLQAIDKRRRRALTAVAARCDCPNISNDELAERIAAFKGLVGMEVAVRDQLDDARHRPRTAPGLTGWAFVAAMTAPLWAKGGAA